MIEVRDLSVTHKGRRVLGALSLRLAPGELVGLIGPPEAGKTLLFKAMVGLVAPSTGVVHEDGAPVPPEVLRLRTGMAFQNNALFDALTVYDNVAFPLRRRRTPESEVQKRVTQRLREVELLAAKDKLPSEISGGMRKRVGIARATVVEPRLGLFDDPVAGLDPITASRIVRLIAEETRRLGMCSLVASNDLPLLLPMVTRVLMLWRGELIYDGPPEGLPVAPRPEVTQFVLGAQ